VFKKKFRFESELELSGCRREESGITSVESDPASVSSSPAFNLLHRTSNWPDSCPSSSVFIEFQSNVRFRLAMVVEVRTIACRIGTSVNHLDWKRGPFLKGIDVNRIPPLTARGRGGGRRLVSEQHHIEHQREEKRERSAGASDDEDGDNSRKSSDLSKDQSAVLEESFKEHNTLNPKQKLALAKRLGLRPRQVEVWFQNRRARTKLKQTEVDCEFLKRCCENLTEENRRLQKELQELRALKLSPQFYMQMAPPTTLTMCPSCERVAAPPMEKPIDHQHNPSRLTIASQNHHHRALPFHPWSMPANQVVQRQMSALHPRS
ncbi:hypothetical protein R6Q59_015312, partial [Mikania micrantha]